MAYGIPPQRHEEDGEGETLFAGCRALTGTEASVVRGRISDLAQRLFSEAPAAAVFAAPGALANTLRDKAERIVMDEEGVSFEDD